MLQRIEQRALAILTFCEGGMCAFMTECEGMDPRGAPGLDPLWALLDTTPEGRGKDGYPERDYA
ncbi:hypothetical protein [Cupriavidus lacunae]